MILSSQVQWLLNNTYRIISSYTLEELLNRASDWWELNQVIC